MRLGDEQRHLRILKHKGQTFLGIGGVERHIGAAGFEDAQQPDQQIQGSLDTHPHPHIRPDAQPTQVLRELIGPAIQLAIGKARVVTDQRDGIGCTLGLDLE
jgi:hypothetical protein